MDAALQKIVFERFWRMRYVAKKDGKTVPSFEELASMLAALTDMQCVGHLVIERDGNFFCSVECELNDRNQTARGPSVAPPAVLHEHGEAPLHSDEYVEREYIE